MKKFRGNPNSKSLKRMYSILHKLRVYSMIPEVGMNILNEGIIVNTAQLGEKLIKAIDFNGRGRLISDLVRFYINLSDLNNNPKSKSLF